MNLEEVKKQALKELEDEEFRRAVEQYKIKLQKQTIWDRIFPWKLVIIKKEKLL